MKRLIVQLRGGLASRLWVFLAAKEYANLTDRKLVVHARQQERTGHFHYPFDARMSDIFDPKSTKFEEITDPVLEHCTADMLDLKDKREEIAVYTHWPALFKPWMFPAWLALTWKDLHPTKELWRHINETPIMQHNRFHIGIVTRTSNASHYATPLDWYRRLDHFPLAGGRMYMACDSEEAQDLADEIGAVYRERKSYEYDREGILAQAANLYMLQRCSVIFGCNRSSYATLAGWLSAGGPARHRWKTDTLDQFPHDANYRDHVWFDASASKSTS